jgi:hypothetical protein
MPVTKYPRFDEIAPSWADVEFTASVTGGILLPMDQIAAVNTGVAVEIGEQENLKRTTGKIANEASITVYLDGYQALIDALSEIGLARDNQIVIGLVKMQLMFQFSVFGNSKIYETRIKGARLKGRTKNIAEGTEPAKVEIPLSVRQVVDMSTKGKEVVFL